MVLLILDALYRHKAEVFPDEDWQEVLQVNLNTVWTLARDVGRHMLERRSAEGGSTLGRGKIINIASLLSYQGGLTVPAYAAAKHGVLGMVSICNTAQLDQLIYWLLR